MSLINDALKQAKESQQRAPLPPTQGPQFRPVEPAQLARHGLGLMVPVGLALLALLALFFVWQMAQNGGLNKSVEARAQSPAAQTPPHASAPLVPAAPAAPVSPAPAPASPALANGAAEAGTNAAVVADPEPPKPAPLKLQAILYNPAHPSALISGKTLFLGDRIGEFRLVTMDRESATLVGAGQTNVLSLDQ